MEVLEREKTSLLLAKDNLESEKRGLVSHKVRIETEKQGLKDGFDQLMVDFSGLSRQMERYRNLLQERDQQILLQNEQLHQTEQKKNYLELVRLFA